MGTNLILSCFFLTINQNWKYVINFLKHLTVYNQFSQVTTNFMTTKDYLVFIPCHTDDKSRLTNYCGWAELFNK